MRTRTIALIGAVALVVVFALSLVQIGFVVLSVLTIGLIVIGYVVVPPLRPRFDVLIQPGVTEEQQDHQVPIVIQGKEIRPTAPVRLVFEIRSANRSLLIAIGLLASGGLYGFLRTHNLLGYYDPNYSFGAMLWALEYLIAGLAAVAFIWLGERLLIRNGVAVLALITGRSSGRLGSYIAYEFRSPDGSFFGGIRHEFIKVAKNDNLIPTIVSRINPDNSKPACSFIFHRVTMCEVPPVKS